MNDSLRIGRYKVEAEFDEKEFTTTRMNEMVDEAYIKSLDNNTDSDVRNPDKFFKKGIFGRNLINWLQTKIGFTNLPLFYDIHKDTTPLTMYHSELIIYNSSLTTSILKYDSRKVANILIPLFMDTDAFEWVGIKLTQHKGREVWLDLVSHYN